VTIAIRSIIAPLAERLAGLFLRFRAMQVCVNLPGTM
jgi:hypothetical protein